MNHTTDAPPNPVPFTLSVNPTAPAKAVAGLKVVTVGDGLGALLTLNVIPVEVPPPGAEVMTSTLRVPTLAVSPAEIVALRWVLSMKVVARVVPFQRIKEPLMKFVPVTLRVNPEPPADAEFGLMFESVGAGLTTAFVVKVRPLDVPPPGAGVFTVTGAVPTAATSEPRIDAVSCVELTKAVVRGEPFQRTVAPLTKFVPVTARVKAASPAVFEMGESKVAVGDGFVTVRESEFWPPRL